MLFTDRDGRRTVTIGFEIQEVKKTIRIRTDTDDLSDIFEIRQEGRDNRFNEGRERTPILLVGLLTNEDRHGYMACPCLIASGNRRRRETSCAGRFT
jgi:hypothetical protein